MARRLHPPVFQFFLVLDLSQAEAIQQKNNDIFFSCIDLQPESAGLTFN